MKPTAPLRGNFSVFTTTPCRGLSLSRQMVKRKLPAILLLTLGIIWALVSVWFDLVMSGIAEPEYPMPIMYLIGLAGPALLSAGAVIVIADWHARIGAICCIVACVWLTWSLGAMIFDSYSQPVIHPNNAIASPYTLGTFIAVAIEAAFFIVADIAAVILLRNTNHLTKRSSQPLAGA